MIVDAGRGIGSDNNEVNREYHENHTAEEPCLAHRNIARKNIQGSRAAKQHESDKCRPGPSVGAHCPHHTLMGAGKEGIVILGLIFKT